MIDSFKKNLKFFLNCYKSSIYCISFTFIFSFFTIYRQISFGIFGNTTHSGEFYLKISQSYKYLAFTFLFTIILLFFLFLFKNSYKRIKKIKNFFKCNLTIPLKINLDINFFLFVLFVPICIFYIYSSLLPPNRFDHDPKNHELYLYFTYFIFAYLISFLITKKIILSFLFPVLLIALIAHPLNQTFQAIQYFGISADFYHSGEYYIPGRLLSEGYWKLYDLYYPSRGFQNYFPGLIAKVLGRSNDFNLYSYYQLTFIKGIFVLFFFIFLIKIPYIWRSTIAILLGSNTLAVGLVVTQLWFLSCNYDEKKPVNFIFLTSLLMFLLLFYHIPMAALCSVSLFFFIVSEFIKNKIFKLSLSTLLPYILIPCVFILLYLLVSPGGLFYLTSHGPINTAAHGIYNKNFLTLDMSFLKYGFLIFLPFFLSFSFHFEPYNKFKNIRVFLILISSVIIIGTIRFLGRDDIGYLSRPYQSTLLACWASIIILTFISTKIIKNSFFKVLFFLTILILIYLFSNTSFHFNKLQLFDTYNKAGNLVNLNKKLDSISQNKINTVKAFINNHQNQCDYYSDITGNNAFYVFFKEMSILPVTSSYNAVSYNDQLVNINRINSLSEQGNLCIRLIGDNVNHDGGIISNLQRSPYLISYILKNFHIVNTKNQGVWFSSQRINNGSNDLRNKFKKIFNYSNSFNDIGSAPYIWGKEIENNLKISAKMKSNLFIETIKQMPYLFFRVKKMSHQTCSLNFLFNNKHLTSLNFEIVGSGLYALPLYASYHWFLEEINKLEIDCSKKKESWELDYRRNLS